MTVAIGMIAIGLAVPIDAGAAPVRMLPAKGFSVKAPAASKRDCSSALRRGARSTAGRAWVAPMEGFVTVSLRARRASDWDLALFSGRTRMASSESFGPREVAQTWVRAGDRLRIQACRLGGAAQARVTVRFADVALPETDAKPQLLEVAYSSPAELEALEQVRGLDVTHRVRDGSADVITADPNAVSALARLGFSARVLDGDLTATWQRDRLADARYSQRLAAAGSGLPSGRTSYRNYDDIQSELKALVRDHPNLVRPVTLPERSFQGRALEGVEIAANVNAAEEDGRPVYLVVALHHAREWPSAEAAMELAHMLVDGNGTNPRITSLLSRERVVIVPLINPDGYISSRGMATFDPVDNGVDPALPVFGNAYTVEVVGPPGGMLAYRRKNCDGAFASGAVPCELQYGVDPNRNYGERWGGPGSSIDRFSQSYRGTGPWSEPETQAVHEYSQQRQVTNIITLHNVAALVLRPPGTKDNGFAPDEARMKYFGDAMAAATGYTSQYGFQLYDTTGTTEDWNYAAQGAYGYTIEIGPAGGRFHMPYETGFVDQWLGTGGRPGLREALLIGAEAAASDADHAMIEGEAKPGATLTLSKSFNTYTSPYCAEGIEVPMLNNDFGALATLPTRCIGGRLPPKEIADGLKTHLTVPESGEFEWHVNPSTRPFVGVDRQVPGFIRSDPYDTKTTQASAAGLDNSAVDQEVGDDTSASEADHPFTVNGSEGAARVVVSLEWAGPADDYDLYVYRRAADGTLQPAGVGTSVGVSGNSAGTFERLVIEPVEAGDYVARVRRYAAVDDAYTLRVERFNRTAPTTVPGGTEAWTLTCEADGQQVDSQQVVVDRGESAEVEFARGCQDKKPKKPKKPKKN